MTQAERVVVIGASGFGRETLDVLDAMNQHTRPIEVAGVVDDAPTPEARALLAGRGVAYLGSLGSFLDTGATSARYLLAIGSPGVRARLVRRLDRRGFIPFTAVHPSATFGHGTIPGPGNVICAGVAVSSQVSLGAHVHLNPHATIGHDAVLADFVSVNPAATVSGAVRVAEGVLLGAGSITLQGVGIGPRSTVGAGAVVTRDVPSDVVVIGIPGRWDAAPHPVGAAAP